ncbi:hypothetical protein M407DRAFT_24002 [Tulasnella calospora MUT 4182]|uniref:DUF6533 domain-containing protein n=1 Tax=Tulasnella calospora MUT 4182 TaxID=1051891 RepID=A0A0C3KZ77_9AGAM|nr:hypothetical protein M407DRAFT_24002 [Tulasnella calospora MUT 4182]
MHDQLSASGEISSAWAGVLTGDCLVAGFTVLVWDHICTIDEEIQFWWTAAPSAVKYMFLLMAPHIHYDPLAKACVVSERPSVMSIIWIFALTSETVVFVLTLIKVLEHRASNQINNPLMDSLHYGQIIYNVVSSQFTR